MSVAIDRATNMVDVTGDVGPFTLTVGANTVNDADGLDISLTGLNLSNTALTAVTVTSADGSATFGAMAPLAAATVNQESLKAKLNYMIYALSAAYNSGADNSVEVSDLLSNCQTAYSNVTTFIANEADATSFNDTYNGFTAGYVGVPAALAAADSNYILPHMSEIMAYYNANPANAAAFQESMLKVWWNKLDTANDAALNTLIEAQIKALYPDVNSVL